MPDPEELHLQLLIPRRLLRPIRRLVSAATAALAATRRSTAAAGAAIAAAIRSIVLAGFRLLPAVVGRQGSVTARAVVPATAAAAKIGLNVHILQNNYLNLARFRIVHNFATLQNSVHLIRIQYLGSTPISGSNPDPGVL